MVALHKDDKRTSPPTPLHQVESGAARPQLRIIAPADAPLPLVPVSMLVDRVDYRDEGCEFARSCLQCPFEHCKYDDPDVFTLDAARRDREIARIRREYRAPIAMLVKTYGLSKRQIYRVLLEQGVSDNGRGKRRPRKRKPPPTDEKTDD